MDKEDASSPVNHDQTEDNVSDLSDSDGEGEGVEEDEEFETDESGSDVSENDGDGISGISSDESDGGSDKCAICLQKFLGQEIGLPETCEHYFCLKCLTQWSKKVATCPVDRKIFPSILVKDDINGPVLRIVDVEIPNIDNAAILDEYDTDPTYCEICGHCDREERLLLCDGCDLGYHLECLEPPLEYVPIEDWYCATCEAQRSPEGGANSSNVISRPSRRQLRLPRTGQSRRIIESIRQSVRGTAPTSCTRNATTSVRPVRNSTKVTRKASSRKRKTSRRKTTRKAGRKRKRRTRKGQKRSRVAIERRPTTAKGRLAVHLGIVPPRPGQVYVGLPSCRASSSSGGHSSNSSALRNLRYQAGITPLRMFSTSDDLADFVETVSDDDEGLAGSARLNKPTKSSIPSTSRFDYHQQQTSSDVLGPILNNQMIMLTDRNIQIKRDGTLVPSISEDTKRATVKSSPDSASGSVIYSRSNYSNPFANSLTSSSAETRQAPTSPHSNEPDSADSSNGTNKHHTVNADSASWNEGSPPSRQSGEKSTWNTLPHSSSSGSKDDPNGTKAYEKFLYSADRKFPNKNDKKQSDMKDNSEPKNPDDDEDFNIYSDIEEDAVSQDPDPIAIETETLAVKENEDSSDSELIIDEDRRISSAMINKRGSPPNADREGRESIEKHYPLSPVSSNFGGVLSPYSIPLPDSTPPPVLMQDEDPHGSNTTSEDKGLGVRENSVEIISCRDRTSLEPFMKPSLSQSKEEYDPSQPLTSSDEEEHSTILTNPPRLPDKPTRKRVPINRQANAQKEDVDIDEDLSSIPMPSDDYIRPTIQFSIPTRHKLISISSLIKRQRGVAKKENRNEQNFASEVSKAFGEDKTDDFAEDPLQANQGGEKVSLVAEIFGSDEDDEEEKDDKIDEENASASSQVDEKSTTTGRSTVPTIVVPFEEIKPEDCESRLHPLTNDSTRWKKIIADVRDPESLPQTGIPIRLDNDDDRKEDSNDSIEVIETIHLKKRDADDDIQVLSISKPANRSRSSLDVFSVKSKPIETEKHSVLENVSEDSKEAEQSIPRADPISSTMCKDKNDREPENKKECQMEETKAKQSKRKRSHTPNPNHEDGEIVDSPEKGRKKKKDRKQRKTKEDKSRAAITEKKIVESINFAQNSSEEENKSQLVFWKKSSNSTKERNYRDGKPKPEEKYFKTSDKKTDYNSKEYSDRNTKDNDKGKFGKNMYDTRRISRRSESQRSRSRSLSASRNNTRKFNSRARRSSSANRSLQSRSRSRSLVRSRNRGRFSMSPRRTRSGSHGSPRLRSRSPLKPKKNRRRSASSTYSRRQKDRKRSESSSSSTSSKLERKTTRDKISGKHKSKKEKNKRKDKLPELEHTKEKDKDREKDKDKKKRKKRREKSVSPSKEIFADGDSIVVSLNFKKINPVTATDKIPSKNEQEGEKKKKRNRTRHNRSRESAEGGKPRLLKKTLLIDLESSPVQEQNIGVSPTLIVLSDDENTEPCPEKNPDNLKERGKDGTSVSITNEICHKADDMSPYKLGVPADSTQLQNSMTTDPKPEGSNNFSFSNSKAVWKTSNLTPTRGDSQVTSTRDSESGIHQDDESRSPPRSPSGTVDNGIVNYPYSSTGSLPPIPFGAQPSLHGNIRRTNENASDSNANGQPPYQSSSNLGKPLIGNILGLFPSSSLSSSSQGGLIAPLPNVIPIPPVPQPRLESSANQNMFTTNVLASMATALYAPILAARQQQQTIGTGSMSSNMNSANACTATKSISSSGTVLLPKTQINQGSGKRYKAGNTTQSTGGGDSPFSPNSSEGDDLFEPPLDRSSQSDASTPNKAEKVNSSQSSNPTPSSASNANGNKAKPREKSSLFDSLFGPAPMKNSHQKGHSKSSKGKNSGGHSKSKSKKTKKEYVKLTEGELRLTEDVPNSAVELRVKEKFLMKLNHQDRVVEEVKLSLKPHYNKKHVTKEEYKEILRRAVPKICHNKSGEINPLKIKELVEAYVKKFRHSHKK